MVKDTNQAELAVLTYQGVITEYPEPHAQGSGGMFKQDTLSFRSAGLPAAGDPYRADAALRLA
jgi:hypothetical protein